jgi:glutamate dehydrogenase (NADP+)
MVGEYHSGKEPWEIEGDIAVPSATQNEIDEAEAKSLSNNGVEWVAEAANMPTTAKAAKLFKQSGVTLLPAKAVNAGGVSVSGLEMAQNAQYLSWTDERVDNELQTIMKNIHDLCVEHSLAKEGVDYAQGANIAGFKKVADAMKAYGTL